MSVNYVFYCSTATRVFKQSELVELLTKAKENNERHQLSGMLLYRGDLFIQWLEGPEAELDALLARIKQDRRHRNIRVMSRGVLSARAFPDWSMAFKNLSGLREELLPGYSELMQAGADLESANVAARKMLETMNNFLLQSA